jgi:hypothetical protein
VIGDGAMYVGNGAKYNGYVRKRFNQQTECGDNKTSGVIFCRDGRFCRGVGFCNAGVFPVVVVLMVPVMVGGMLLAG